MYEYLAVVHCIADSVLSVAVYYDSTSVKICAQSVTGSTLNGNCLACNAAAYVTLSHSVGYRYILVGTFDYLFIKVVITYLISI